MPVIETSNIKIKKQEEQGTSILEITEKVDDLWYRHSK